VLINSVGSVQELIDLYGASGRLSRVLQVISNQGFLPASTLPCSIPGRNAYSHPKPCPVPTLPEIPNTTVSENITRHDAADVLRVNINSFDD
jgi:hypothetical protein